MADSTAIFKHADLTGPHSELYYPIVLVMPRFDTINLNHECSSCQHTNNTYTRAPP